MDTVKTETGYISGTILGERGKEVYVYRGIPYAAPPIGDLRWKPPQPVAPWLDIRECTVFSKQAPHGPPITLDPISPEMSEDCLYLNIFTPAKKPNDRLPVMVWLHGGGLTEGNGNRPIYTGLGLPWHGVVLVNVNTRLGVMGLLAHPLLSRESPHGVSGNYLFIDIIAALKWVQKNIEAFGGDSGNVTIFGQSGGGIKVTSLLSSPLAKGLFHRAIIESGAGLRGLPLKGMEIIGEKLFAILGVEKERDPLNAARALPWKKIIDAYVALDKDESIPKEEKVAVDGWFLPDTPLNIFKAGKQNAVPLMSGSNLGELPTHGVRMKHISYYLDLFKGNSRVGVKSYAYVFDHVPAGWRQDGCISCHAMELPYVFGTLDKQYSWDLMLVVAHNNNTGGKTSQAGVTDTDRKVSEAMMSMWTQFAKTGDPSVKGLVAWPAYETTTDKYLFITDSLIVKSGFSMVG